MTPLAISSATSSGANPSSSERTSKLSPPMSGAEPRGRLGMAEIQELKRPGRPIPPHR